MNTHSEKDFHKKIAQKGGFTEWELGFIIPKIENLKPELYKAINSWLDNDVIVNIEIEGYSITRLMNHHKLEFIAAVLTLDWLQRDPQSAKAALSKGHDKIN